MSNHYATSIKWMTGKQNPEDLGLPSEVELPKNIVTRKEIAYFLRDKTGWPVKSFGVDSDHDRERGTETFRKHRMDDMDR